LAETSLIPLPTAPLNTPPTSISTPPKTNNQINQKRLILLPFGVFPEASWSALLPVFAMATMMLGLEDVTNQMEDPYAFIPYEAMVATTAKDMPRTLREVRACKAAVDAKADALFGKGKDAAAAALPPWPVLLPRKQYYAS
jgi:hypothetical protein